MSENTAEESSRRWATTLRRLRLVGWGCLLLSALCLYISAPLMPGRAKGAEVTWAIYVMVARLLGTVAFAIGGVAIFNRRWFEGIAMSLLAIVLPFVSLLVHGTV